MRAVYAFALAGTAALVLYGQALATPVHIANDPNGIQNSNYNGVALYSSADAYLYVNVEFCVYKPGAFRWADPSNGTQYVYAYEIFNNLPDPLYGEESDYVRRLSLHLNKNEQVTNLGYIDLADQQSPTSYSIASKKDSLGWWFDPTVLAYGSVSDILFFTSPFEPELDNATVTGYSPYTQILPSPSNISSPEPASIAIFTLAAAVFLNTRRRKLV